MHKNLSDIKRRAGRLGGLARHIVGDSDQIAANARRGLQAWFERMALAIDPTLTGERLTRKIALLQREHMCRAALASARARRKNSSKNTQRENAARPK